MLHCVDAAFIADQALDHLPLPSRIGRSRVGGVDINKPRMRAVLAAVLALAPAPDGFSVSQFGAKVRALGGPTDQRYGTRQAAYDLRHLFHDLGIAA